MSNLSRIVTAEIQTLTAGNPRASFSVPLILAPNAVFSERVRSYEDESEISDDGFSTTGPEYLAAQRMFQQNPKPTSVMLGRCAALQQKFRMTPVAANSLAYAVTVDGLPATYTSDGTALLAEITAGLKTAIDALAISGCTTTDNATSLDISFTSGQLHSVVVAPTLSGRASGPMAVLETTTDPGLATDLAAIEVENSGFYGIQCSFHSKAIVDAVGAWAESNDKLYVAQTCDSAVMNTTLSGTDDVGESTKGSALFRTAVQYHEDPKALLDAALLGKLLPKDPGTEKWSLVQLVGVTASTLTATQINNLKAKNVTSFITIGAVAVTYGGKVAGGEWTDIVRLRDGVVADVGVEVANLKVAEEKLGYIDSGISKVQGAIMGVLLEYEEGDPPPLVPGSSVVTVPTAASTSTADRAARTLNGVKFDAQLTGGIYLTNIRGTLSV